MGKKILYIIIGVIVVGLIVFVVLMFVSGNGTPGSIIAILAGVWASFKAKLFQFKNRDIEAITQQHDVRQDNWAITKTEYDSKINSMVARMDYLEYKSAKISLQINDLKIEEKAKIEEFNKMNDVQKEEFVNNLLNSQ